MKRKIAVITGSRAEYGLLYWTLKAIEKSAELDLQLIVTGMHLSSIFGNTYKQIISDGFHIDKKIHMVVSGDSPICISKSLGLGCIGFAEAYEQLQPDMLLVLGDRYEIMCAVMAAVPFQIPIAHIAGGEITEGVIDEQIRHAITKIAHIHFPGSKVYAQNILKMGEEAWRIFNVGDSGIEAIKNSKLLSKREIYKDLGLDLVKKTILVTLHPTTLNSIEREEEEARCFFEVLKEYNKQNIVITYPNSDTNNYIIINEIKKLEMIDNIHIFISLGNVRYLSILKHCDLVMGNTSSGIAEAPFFKKAVINYGDRQKGRLKAQNIMDVIAGDEVNLKKEINRALYDDNYLKQLKTTEMLYGSGDTSSEIVQVLSEIELNDTLIKKKLVF